MKLRKRLYALATALLLVATLAACGDSPPKDLSDRASSVASDIASTKDLIQQSRESLDKELAKNEYKFMAGYSDADKHKPKFDEASRLVDEADKKFADTVKNPLDDYDAGNQGNIIGSLDSVQKLVDDAKALAKEPSTWIMRVLKTKQDPAGYVQAQADRLKPLADTSVTLVEAGNAAKAAWPQQTKAIDERVGKANGELKAAGDALAKLQNEARMDPPNYAVMTTLGDQVAFNSGAFTRSNTTVLAQLDELPTSETHTLIDIKVEGEIEVGRTSWSESTDCCDNDYDYQPVVTNDAELLAYFSQFQPGTMIASDGSWSDFRTESGVEKSKWDALGIDSRKDFPGWDDSAEYYLDGVDITTCYKLKVLRNGMPDSSVKPADAENPCAKHNNPKDLANGMFWDEAEGLDADNIGMDIYSKAAGDFTDQATEAASPPGIVYVGDPRTGEWRNTNDNDPMNDFWVFYGQYAFFSNLIGGPSPYLNRYEYDTWNRNYRRQEQNYYAGGAAAPRFGGGSPQAGSRFPGFKTSKLGSPSVRSAGPSVRGGGPGGGGK